jgi:hypothetical protein
MTKQELLQQELNPTTAAAALAHAEKAQAIAGHAVRVRSGWTSRFLATFGVTSVVFLALCGVAGVIAYVASWIAYGVISTSFARRERVSWRGFDRLSGRCFAAWFVLQGIGCAVGFNFFSGELAYWIPVALLVSSPFFIGAWVAAHR